MGWHPTEVFSGRQIYMLLRGGKKYLIEHRLHLSLVWQLIDIHPLNQQVTRDPARLIILSVLRRSDGRPC